MTTYFGFTPSRRSAPNFMPTLDGTIYNCTVTWNLQGQRYFLNVFTLGGVLVLSIAIVETAPGIAVNTATYDPLANMVTLTTAAAHNISLGMTISMAVTGFSPDDFNGPYRLLATGAQTLTYTPATVPAGPATKVGTASSMISLVAGYFDSTLIFRSGRFEVSP